MLGSVERNLSGMLFEVESASIFWVESRAARGRVCHQINLEYLAQVVCDRDGNGSRYSCRYR